MKQSRLFKTAAGSAFVAMAMMCGASLTVSCSSDDLPGKEQTTLEEGTFPIYLHATQGSPDGTRAAGEGEGNGSQLTWFAPNGEEEILPEGWNDPLGEAQTAPGKPKKTRYVYDANRNYMEVVWKDADQIGVKTIANATSGSGAWTKLTLQDGIGRKTAVFEGIASATNGLSQTGNIDITAVYPYSATGSYSFATQPGTITGLGDYDVRVDNGTLINGTVKDVHLVTKIAVLRIEKIFFDDGAQTKTKGYDNVTVTVSGPGVGNELNNVCASNETAVAGKISVTVPIVSSTGIPNDDVYIAFAPIDTDQALFTVEVEVAGQATTYSMYEFYKSHFETGKLYNLRHPGTDISEQCIEFKDSKVRGICMNNYNLNNDGCISYREARAVYDLATVFRGTDIQWFPELQYFENVSGISSYAFEDCKSLEEIVLPNSVTYIGEKAFLNTKIEEVGAPLVTSIGVSGFQGCSSLQAADFPLLTSIGASGFQNCSSLQAADFPLLTSIGVSGFRNCSSLQTANFPLVTSIESYLFYNCKMLQAADFPLVTSIGQAGFCDCTSLQAANFPLVTTIGESGFTGCKMLQTANFPLVTTVGGNGFSGCSSLQTVNFPLVTSVGSNGFARCTSLQVADFSQLTSPYYSMFDDCTSLQAVYLRNPSVLKYHSSFVSSVANLGATIYVPANLVISYKAEYSAYADIFRPIP